jgi:O-antigen ligase
MKLIEKNGIRANDPLGISLILVVLTMPFNNQLNSYAIVTFCILATFSNSLAQKIKLLNQERLFWLMPSIYFIGVIIHFLLDDGKEKSTILLETNASLIAIPIIMGSMRKISEKSVMSIMIFFVIGNLTGSLYCLFGAYETYRDSDNYINVFFYHHLSEHIGINAIYFSMYCLFCIMILFYYYFLKANGRIRKILSGIAIVYLSFFMILLSSKMFIFLLCLFGLGLIGYSLFHFRKLRRGAIFILLLCMTIPVLLSKIPYAKSRIEYTQVKKYQGVEDNNNGLAVRGVLWESSWNLIKGIHEWTGWGHFTAQESLRKLYLLAGFQDGAERNDNSHNQYLYTWVCYGLIGLFILLIFLFRFLWIAINRKIFLGIFLAIMFIVANITECMFEAQKGIVFFLFFSSLLVFHASTVPLAISKEKDSFD